MKFIFGLGNPGSKYGRTRHNVGFEVLDSLARQLAPGQPATCKFDALCIEATIDDEKVLLLKPQTFMNKSGNSVKQAISFYKADAKTDILVIVDDIHLSCGQIRMRTGGTAGGHNGLSDILNHIGDEQWARLRIGVDSPETIPQADYVLGKFTEEQWTTVEPSLGKAVRAAELWIRKGAENAMNTCNETETQEK